MADAVAALGLTAHQLRNARGIIAAVKKRDWSAKAAVIAVETALAEAGLRMLASANVPESQKYPYVKLNWTADGLGHDHASMGMFQQQTGTAWTPAGYGRAMNQTTMNSPNGWGPPSVLMDPEKSTELFLNKLGKIDWANWDPWLAAQHVQVSAFADGSNYRSQHAKAVRIVNALWITAAIPKENDMLIVQDKKTKRCYTIAAGDRPALVSQADAKAIARLYGLAIKAVEHADLLAYDQRYKLVSKGI